MGTADQNNKNAPVAFLLVTAAGLSTCLGAAMVFNKRLVKLASKRFLAGSLGVAAGVMLYVSLVEIFVKSQVAFSNSGYSDADAYMYATVSLFGGILFYKGIDLVVHLLDGTAGDHNVDIDLYDLDEASESESNRPRADGANDRVKKGARAIGPKSGIETTTAADTGCAAVAPSGTGSGGGIQRNSSRSFQPHFPHEHDVVVELNSGHGAVRPSPDLHTLHLRIAGRVHQQPASPVSAMTPDRVKGGATGGNASATQVETRGEDELVDDVEGGGIGRGKTDSVGGNGGVSPGGQGDEQPVRDEKLVRMGLMTAVAIGIHNFPEGLATFVGALSNPSLGFALAVAIAIHNIPEGLCVAIPVFYATGNRWKSFGWALLSGVSEPIGAGLGWLILKDIMSELVYGILFGMVAGMMINITIHELIPTAVRYDPADKVTTNSIIAGMAVMALSLVLFLY